MAIFGAGVTLQFQPLTWVVIGVIVAIALLNWIFNTRRTPRPASPVQPQGDVVSYIGGGHWARAGVGGLGARWPLLRLTASTDTLYYGPNDHWPLARFHSIPRWQVARTDVAVVSSGLSVVHVKLKDGRDLVFSPVFVTPKAILEALVARGYPANSA
jgi:hypothetical protein